MWDDKQGSVAGTRITEHRTNHCITSASACDELRHGVGCGEKAGVFWKQRHSGPQKVHLPGSIPTPHKTSRVAWPPRGHFASVYVRPHRSRGSALTYKLMPCFRNKR